MQGDASEVSKLTCISAPQIEQYVAQMASVLKEASTLCRRQYISMCAPQMRVRLIACLLRNGSWRYGGLVDSTSYTLASIASLLTPCPCDRVLALHDHEDGVWHCYDPKCVLCFDWLVSHRRRQSG
jgi:hypothetical protein